MPRRIALIYSTTDGQTLKICRHLQTSLEASGMRPELLPLAEAARCDLGGFDQLVIGASIRYGRHAPEVAQFIEARAALLAARPSAFFSVNLVARKAGKDEPQSNPYARRFLRTIPWQPRRAAVFAGRLDYPRYGFWDRLIIRCIMLLTGGPTDPTAVVEYTDWHKVEEFAAALARLDPQ